MGLSKPSNRPEPCITCGVLALTSAPNARSLQPDPLEQSECSKWHMQQKNYCTKIRYKCRMEKCCIIHPLAQQGV